MSKGNQKRTGLPVIHESAAGIDIGSRFHVVAVPPGLADQSVQSFQAFTADLQRMADWLIQIGITTVAMESTGVYWVPVYEILEERGIEVVLANAREGRTVPGRKTDVNDAQWLQRLHACGLIRASFRPGREISALRAYLRLRERHLDYGAAHIQHMQKALTFMNLQLHHVLSDITGVTGMKIIRAIVGGERDLEVLAAMRDVRYRATTETIRAALSGNYQPEHLFALSQALALYDVYQSQVQQCDIQIEAALAVLCKDKTEPAAPLPKARHTTRQPNAVVFDTRPVLYQLIGVDLTQIHGIGLYLALRLVAECGTDLSRWSSAKHFTSWLTLSPGSKISGGKVLSAHTRKTNNRLTAHLRLAAIISPPLWYSASGCAPSGKDTGAWINGGSDVSQGEGSRKGTSARGHVEVSRRRDGTARSAGATSCRDLQGLRSNCETVALSISREAGPIGIGSG